MERIVIGKVLKPQGVKGEIKVQPITDDANRFNVLESVFIGEDEYDVLNVCVRKDGVFMLLSGIDNRNGAESVRNKFVSVPRELAVKNDKDSFFIVDLIGCKVKDETGKNLGVLSDVLQNGSADVYCVDKNKIMFPALKKVLKSVDIERKEITVDSKALSEVAVYED